MAYVPPISAYDPARITDGVIPPTRPAPALTAPAVTQQPPAKTPKPEPGK